MPLKHSPPWLSFAAFVTWLLAVPMDGPLAAAAGIDSLIIWFLPTHVISLVAIGYFCPEDHLKRASLVAIPLSVILTLLLPLSLDTLPWLACLLGFSGAIVAIRACTRLQFAQNPVISAASGLIAANLLLFLLTLRSAGSPLAFCIIALPLLALLLPATAPARLCTFEGTRNLSQLWIFLPFILLFHIVGGLMYSVLYPAYLEAPLLPGLELLFYVGSIAGSALLVARHREVLLVGGILLAMLVFVLLQHPHPLAINFSMYAMQASQGLVDLFLITCLLRFQPTQRAFGFGLGALCLGIFTGQLIGRHLQDFIGDMTLYGLISLNLAALSLYLYRNRLPRTRPSDATVNNQNNGPEEESPPTSPDSCIPATIRLQLSERETMVLEQSLSGRTYREIAAQLEISDSSVKTYMQRVYGKLNIHGRKGLLDLLTQKP